ncbi:MAG: UDP-N-acetylmuramoyl-L-alanyl-D-glutamate--2,6-diaminopimelate ligase [Cellvibrionaceae bacterium]|nr:UDP-N-acetylmuramoyl-L-alanyl-D-glutamate--2,6-diaminopimelate ligase [Cellvibrionaceae bacterium]
MAAPAFSRVAVGLGLLLPELRLPEAVADLQVSGVCQDSRQLVAGDLFIALSGGRADGRNFIGDALGRGAVAVLVEAGPQSPAGEIHFEREVPIVSVANLAVRVSEIASKCYGDPSTALQVIGITGTNGKSTTVSLMAQLYGMVAGRAATLGTLGVSVDGKVVHDFGLTTPDASLCQKLLADLRAEMVNFVAMEVSSHGLDQHRVAGVKFRAGIFTNLTHDHLDYHGTLQNYAAAKRKLFETMGLQAAIINLDDPFAPQMVAAAKARADVYSYSLLHFAADVYASELLYSAEGVEFRLTTPWGKTDVISPLLGEFNVYNLLAAVTTLCAIGCDFSALVAAIPQLQPVPGRMQRIAENTDVMAVVDYAHTPDALSHAIAATRVHTSGKLWVVFGCGGDRDRSKRPVMASIAERFADHVIVTNDNPRTENPDAILREICEGFSSSKHLCVADRAQAIAHAIAAAQSGDVVLIAGKGHETYQIIGSEKRNFSDVAEAVQALRRRPLAQGRGA